ncbi:MAG: DegT/DnrJ/EryC1/StrS family aminotransferase [Alphaproteobacteria bacterium]|nr:DegT/DnrJ/EryC1/StrS family aminotransferase [Alphaproteobacteria bacterium]
MIDPTRVPFANLSLQWKQIKDAALPDIEKLFDQSAFCLGPWVASFEKAVSEYLGVKHAIAVNSGTSALHLATTAAGIGPGDKVLVPAQTFIATIWGVLYRGATPILCDVEESTATIDPAEIEKRIEPGVKAIIPVHLFGQPAKMKEIMAIAKKHNLKVIEDVAQAIGGTYEGRKLSGIGDFGCISFYPGKNLGGAGEGGLVTTNDDKLAEHVRSLRDHGSREKYKHVEVGYNYRMEGLQGLVLGHKLPLLNAWTDERQAIAKRYQEAFKGLPIDVPQIVNGDHVWHLFVIRTPHRDKLREHLNVKGIDTGLHYPIPIHRQPALESFAIDRGNYPQADRWASQGLTLPVFVGMTQEQQTRVIEGVRSFFNE